MPNKFNWSVPSEVTNPICFSNITHSVRGSTEYRSMESWSVEEIDIHSIALNFRTTSSEAGNIIICFSGTTRIGTLTLSDNISPGIFYTVKIEYPKSYIGDHIKYRNIILKSQSQPSYPVFAFNSHTHLNLWSPMHNRYEPRVATSLVNEAGSISAGENLINENTLTVGSTNYITPIMTDIYDFR